MKRDDSDEIIPSHVRGSELDRGLTRGFPSSEELKVNVVDALTWADDVDATSIQVWVSMGVVTLYGDVGSEEERARAEEVARDLPDVVDVINRLEVRR